MHHHHLAATTVLGHVALIVAELAAVVWLLRRKRSAAIAVAVLDLTTTLAAAVYAPAVVVTAGHIAAFVGILLVCGWAFGVRLVGSGDFTTLPVIVISRLRQARLWSPVTATCRAL